jgi:cyclic pyranopterin phosphate synthase
MATKRGLTHVGADDRPRMVDVSAKAPTRRVAVAEAWIEFPAAAAKALFAADLKSKKGPVVDTAIVAGVMAAKRTHELIPFCHPLALEDCRVSIARDGARRLRIECEVALTGRTGVEMEALTGASVAALAVYDMTKSLSHGIVIGPVRLVGKRGGRRDFGTVR